MSQSYLPQFDVALILRAFFSLGAGVGYILTAFPSLRSRFMNYGSRTEERDSGDYTASKDSKDSEMRSSLTPLLLLEVFSFKVPHSWFTHYYLVSVAWSFIWGYQIIANGPIARAISQQTKFSDPTDSMAFETVSLVWILMLLQGLRRLGESLLLTKTSISTMPLSIYAAGILFYTAVGMAVWIEGAGAILLGTRRFSLEALMRPHSIIFVPVFIVASGVQNDCHRYLASLPKYTLPVHGLFHRIICPHYTAECAIYLSLAFIGAPNGQIINQTLLMTAIFTATNLAVIAKSTQAWSVDKFGYGKISGKWRMIPFLW